MRNSNVRDDEILEAGQRLLAEGKEVNGWALRRGVGDRGKTKRLMSVWEASMDSLGMAENTQPETPSSPLPSKLEERRLADRERAAGIVDSILADAWRLADELAEGRVSEERAAAKATSERAERVLAEATASIDVSVERELALEEQVEELTNLLEQARTEVTRLTERVAVTEAEAARAGERDRLAIADLTERLHQSEASAAQARQETAGASATAAAAQTDADRVRGERDALRRDLDAARAQRSDLASKLSAAEAQVTAVGDALDRERQAAAAAETRATVVGEQMTAATDRAARAEERASGMEVVVNELRGKLADMERQEEPEDAIG